LRGNHVPPETSQPPPTYIVFNIVFMDRR
jgi:hypothetical protein